MIIISMVFDSLLKNNYNKLLLVFLITVFYSITGIILARFIFGANSGIVSVAFIAFLLIPTMRKLFEDELYLELKQKKMSFINFYQVNKISFNLYFVIFIAVFFVFLLSSFYLPQLGINIFNIFQEQIAVDSALKGFALNTYMFFNTLQNNWLILLVCFFLGLIAGNGSIFFVIWNASVWGTIFGYRALTAGIVTGNDPWFYLLVLISIVIWHTLLEGISYILASISGSTISKDVILNKSQIKTFFLYFIPGILILYAFPKIINVNANFFSFILSGLILLIWIYYMKLIFLDKQNLLAFKYNFYLLLFAIFILILAAFIETLVLTNSMTLIKIYTYAMLR